MEKPSKIQVLELLRKGPAEGYTARELADSIGCVRNTVDASIRVLEAGGYVKRGELFQGEGAGRPAHAWTITAKGRKANLDAMMEADAGATKRKPRSKSKTAKRKGKASGNSKPKASKTKGKASGKTKPKASKPKTAAKSKTKPATKTTADTASA